MEKYEIKNDIVVFGYPVNKFPDDIDNTFNRLVEMVGDRDRIYYGISHVKPGGFEYIAATEEKNEGELAALKSNRYLVEQGVYLSTAVTDWQQQKNRISHYFGELLRDERADKSKPCIEIYLNGSEMLCLVKEDQTRGVMYDLRRAISEFIQLVKSFRQNQFNSIPFEGSWTPAQVAQHVHLSITGIPMMLNGTTGPTERDPGEKIAELKKIFLDYTISMQSPPFIIPEDRRYDQEEMLKNLSKDAEALREAMTLPDLSLTCMDFNFPNSGYMTRLEWLAFGAVHVERHGHQLQKIKEAFLKRKADH